MAAAAAGRRRGCCAVLCGAVLSRGAAGLVRGCRVERVGARRGGWSRGDARAERNVVVGGGGVDVW